MPKDVLDQLKTLEELFTVDQAKLKQIVEHFIKELQKGELLLFPFVCPMPMDRYLRTRKAEVVRWAAERAWITIESSL